MPETPGYQSDYATDSSCHNDPLTGLVNGGRSAHFGHLNRDSERGRWGVQRCLGGVGLSTVASLSRERRDDVYCGGQLSPSLKATLFTRVRFIMSLGRLIYQDRATYLPGLVYLEFEECVDRKQRSGIIRRVVSVR